MFAASFDALLYDETGFFIRKNASKKENKQQLLYTIYCLSLSFYNYSVQLLYNYSALTFCTSIKAQS